MVYDAEELLKAVTAVMPIIETGGIEDEHKNIFFNKEYIIAANDRMCIAFPFESNLKCGVPGKEFKSLIPKNGELDLKSTRSNITIKSGSYKASLVKAQESSFMDSFEELNISNIEWKKIPKDLIEGMKFCRTSASRELSEPYLTCVLVKGKDIIASDEVRISHYVMEIGVKGSWLIPARSVNELVKTEVDKYAVSDTWLYFRGKVDKKIMCARRISDDYPDTKDYFKFKALDSVTIPENTKDAIDYVSTMAETGEDDYKQITVSFSGNNINCRGESDLGWAEKDVEIKKKTKSDFTIKINPEFFKEVLSKSNIVKVGKDRVLIEGDNFKHLVALYL